MRQKSNGQYPLTCQIPDHPMAHDLQTISDILDDNPTVCDLVYQDLTHGKKKTGKRGMTAEQVLRCAVLHRILDCSYRELAFHLMDSDVSRWFTRLDYQKKVHHKTLQDNIKQVGGNTWQSINQIVVQYAKCKGKERGKKIRIDTTVVDANIHRPTDSSLLRDSVRVLTRLLRRAQEEFPEAGIEFHDHLRGAKRNALKVANAKNDMKRRKPYKRLINLCDRTVQYALHAVSLLREHRPADPMRRLLARSSAQEMEEYMLAAMQVLQQTYKRVLKKERVPVDQKLVSIFETHTDIIVKDRRDVLYGHKICLSTGASSMILDCVVEEGNPADSSLFIRSLDRLKTLYGEYPRQVAADGGFASKENLRCAKQDKRIKDVAFSKKCGLQIEDMTDSLWLYRKLRNFRAGVEGCISAIKRICGLGRCMWRGLRGFKSYVQCSVVAFNLLILARRMNT
jgi:IS5 family transposase